MTDLPYLLTGICVGHEVVILRGALKVLDEDQVPHTFVACLRDNVWSNFIIWNGVSCQYLILNEKTEIFSLCVNGAVHVKAGADEKFEVIDSKLGLNPLRWMLDLRNIDGSLHVVGMQRAAFRREPSGIWFNIGNGAELNDDEPVDLGFRSIDGFTRNELYAAGYFGEIWRRDESAWRRTTSPTNLRLDKVVALPSGEILIGGASGVIIRGRGERWDVVNNVATDRAISDIAVYGGRILLADGKSLYEFVNNDVVPLADGTHPVILPRYLSVGAGILGIAGRSSAALFDGVSWRNIPLPRLRGPP